jgi:hypothetical protein
VTPIAAKSWTVRLTTESTDEIPALLKMSAYLPIFIDSSHSSTDSYRADASFVLGFRLQFRLDFIGVGLYMCNSAIKMGI